MVRHTKGPGRHGYLKGGRCPPEYDIWASMIQRCYNPRCREYRYYGGRGIRVCDRWLEANGFVNFYQDLGRQPAPRASLNRINNDGDYAPENVRWSTPKEQARNRRTNRNLTFKGETMIAVEWAEKLNLKPNTIYKRIHDGLPTEKILAPAAARLPYSQWKRSPKLP